MRVLTLGLSLFCVAGQTASAVSDKGAVATVANTDSVIESQLSLPRYGSIAIYRPTTPIRSMIVFLSGDGGWHLGVVDAARRFAEAGALVAGVDVRRYLSLIKPANPSGEPPACTYMAADMEALSQQLQRALKLPNYLHPMLVGYSSGATVVYAALAQAPHGTFAGAISMGFCPDQDFGGARLCKANGLEYRESENAKPGNHTLVLAPNRAIREPWILAQGERDRVCAADTTREFVAEMPTARLVSLPRVGHGFAVTANWWPQVEQAYQDTVASACVTFGKRVHLSVVRPTSQD